MDTYRIAVSYGKSVTYICYKVMQVFMVTGLFAGQHNTKLHGTITGVIIIF